MGAIQGGGSSPEPTTSPTEGAVAPSEQPSGEPTEAPEPSEPAEEETLTVENNEDLAALLSGPTDGPTVEEFAASNEGRSIEFDANVGAINNHGGYNTRYDILILAGDYSETSTTGPYFQFRDVNITYDLHLTGSNIPDTIGVGDNLHIIARVGAFNPDNGQFLLEPVSTQFR